jgi:uncharacterized protein (TIGR02246 family)
VNRIVVTALCGMAVIPSLTGRASPRVPTDAAGGIERALPEVAAEWKAAYNAKDAAAVATLYTPDAYYVSAHVLAHGRQAIQAYFLKGIVGGGHIDELQLLSSGQSGELAYWVGTYEATNAGQKVQGRNVLVLRKVGGRWLIVAHESVEADRP